MHAPSGDLSNTSEADGVRTRLFTPPPLDELVALGALEGVDADEVRRRVARYGPTMRHIVNEHSAEHILQSGVSDLGGCLFHVHDPRWIERVDGVTLVLLGPGGIGFMFAFASDFHPRPSRAPDGAPAAVCQHLLPPPRLARWPGV